MTKNKVVIIGAGIGGLATSILLAKKGMRVEIYEKNQKPGGRCQQIINDGHIFDTGPTMYLFPEIYKHFFGLIDEKIEDHLKLVKTKPTYKLFFDDKSSLQLTSNKQIMKIQLESIEPGSYKKYLEFLKNGKKHYDLAINQISKSPLASPLDYFNVRNLVSSLKSKALLPHALYTSLFFKNPKLISAFTFQDSYLSLNPFKTQAIYSLFTYSETVHGNFLPKGGMFTIIKALEKIAIKNGVKINYNSPVKKILTKDKSVTGIILKGGKTIHSNFVISNADLRFTYDKLLSDTKYLKKLEKKRYSCSAMVFHWGLNKRFDQLETNNLFFSSNYKKGFDQTLGSNTPPTDPHFYIQAPSRTDKSRAPKGGDTLTVMVPINHLSRKFSDWDSYKKNLRKYIQKKLLDQGVDIKKHLKFETCYMPADWQNHLNLTKGAVYGLDHNIFQLGYLRPKRQHKKFKNLFFVGASTHPGSGLPTILLSAEFTTNALLKSI
jgi:phytoene desaturase